MADLLFDFNIKKTAMIFEEDESFTKIMIEYGLYYPDISIDQINPLRTVLYEKIATLLLSFYDFISTNDIDSLWSIRYKLNELNFIFEEEIVDEKLFRQLYYTFKYSTVKHFFIDNYASFLPDVDYHEINDKPRKKIFYESFMKEFDRFACIIEGIKNISDVDSIENEYLPYLIQLLGYEKEGEGFLTNDSFRELAKNIIEIYRIKGTSYSFELFFNFLGLGITVNEYWFDKRMYYATAAINPDTNISEKSNFRFYLTTKKPTEYIPEMVNPYQVMENDLIAVKSHLEFARRISNGESITSVLNDYTFFKTNFMQYSLRRIRYNESDSSAFDEKDLELIEKYAEFLTPIFMIRLLNLSASEMLDSAALLILTEDISGALSIISNTAELLNSVNDDMFVNLFIESPSTLEVTEETLTHLDLNFVGNEAVFSDDIEIPKNYSDELYILIEDTTP